MSEVKKIAQGPEGLKDAITITSKRDLAVQAYPSVAAWRGVVVHEPQTEEPWSVSLDADEHPDATPGCIFSYDDVLEVSIDGVRKWAHQTIAFSPGSTISEGYPGVSDVHGESGRLELNLKDSPEIRNFLEAKREQLTALGFTDLPENNAVESAT